MNIKFETVLTITLVVCVLYYLMCRCDCREGLGAKTLHGHVVDNKRMFDLSDLFLDPSLSEKMNIYVVSHHATFPIVSRPKWMVHAEVPGDSTTDEVKNEKTIQLLNNLRLHFGLTSIGVEQLLIKPPFVPRYKINVIMGKGNYRFWDWEGDYYDLTIHRTGDNHTIRYDSKNPRIAALYRYP